MQTVQKFFLFLIVVLALSSCLSQKRIVLVQNNDLSAKATQITNPKPEYVIQSNDVLSITVKTSQADLNEVFNIATVGSSFLNNAGSFYLAGYSVSDSGYISMPTIGKIYVKGLSISQANNLVQKEVSKFLNVANVQLKVISFKVSVLGEVKSPGYFYVYNQQATIFEALGLAGDATDFGNRKRVKIFRQTGNGSEVAVLDLTDTDIMKSKYYYLLPNDVIYVEPVKAKISRSNLQALGVFFGGITAIGVIARFIYDVNN